MLLYTQFFSRFPVLRLENLALLMNYLYYSLQKLFAQIEKWTFRCNYCAFALICIEAMLFGNLTYDSIALIFINLNLIHCNLKTFSSKTLFLFQFAIYFHVRLSRQQALRSALKDRRIISCNPDCCLPHETPNAF